MSIKEMQDRVFGSSWLTGQWMVSFNNIEECQIKNQSYRQSICHAWFQQNIPCRGVQVTRYKFLKFAFNIVQIWFVFPQLSKKHTLNVWLQTSCLKIHFSYLQIISTNISESHNRRKYAFKQKGQSEKGTKASASSIPPFISESFCFFCSADWTTNTNHIKIVRVYSFNLKW